MKRMIVVMFAALLASTAFAVEPLPVYPARGQPGAVATEVTSSDWMSNPLDYSTASSVLVLVKTDTCSAGDVGVNFFHAPTPAAIRQSANRSATCEGCKHKIKGLTGVNWYSYSITGFQPYVMAQVQSPDSACKVSVWTTTMPFVVKLNQTSDAKDGKTLVTTSPTLIGGTAGRFSIAWQTQSTAPIYCGFTNEVTATTGWKMEKGQSMSLDLPDSVSVYCVTETTDQTDPDSTRWWELLR